MTEHSHRRLLVAAAVAGGLVLAGCGSVSAPSRTHTANGSAATGASTVTTAARSQADGRRSVHPSALAFSRCMRANGVPNFPDPQPGGGFEFPASGAVSASPAFRSAQARCQRYAPSVGPLSPGAPPSAKTLAQLRRIASCMREHGVSQFPDPLSAPPPQSSINMADYSLITNYMGAILLYPRTINMQSPAYIHAIAACHAGFLAAQHSH